MEGGAALAVDGVDGSSAGDEEFDDFGPGSPGGYVEGGAVIGDVEVAVAEVEGVGWDAEVKEVADSFGVGVAGELGEKDSAVGDEFGNEVGFCGDESADGFGFVLRAGGDEWVWARKQVEEDVAVFEFIENVAAAAMNGDVDCGSVLACAFEEGVGTVVEQKFGNDETVVAAEGLVERGESPAGHEVWVGAVFEGELDAVFVVPVSFTEEDGVEA